MLCIAWIALNHSPCSPQTRLSSHMRATRFSANRPHARPRPEETRENNTVVTVVFFYGFLWFGKYCIYLYLIIHALYNIYDHESWNLRYLLKQCLHMVCLQKHISNLKWYVKKSWKISSFQSSAAEWGHRLAAPGICRAASAAAEWGRRGSPGFAQRSAELEVRNPNENTGTTAW